VTGDGGGGGQEQWIHKLSPGEQLPKDQCGSRADATYQWPGVHPRPAPPATLGL